MLKKLSISYSAVLDWRTCEQKYWYRYVDKILPRVTAAPLELGTFIHDYLETFYNAAQRQPPKLPDTRRRYHKRALHKMARKSEDIASLAKTASDLGADVEAHSLLAIPDTARNIMRAYYRVWGELDLKTHRVVMVEKWFQLKVKKGIVLPGKIDLVTEDKEGYWLWEHKSTGSIPRVDSRFRDLQTLIYTTALDELYGIKVAGVIWNYIRTKPPGSPKILKNGKLSTAQGQTTTRELVRKAYKDNNEPLNKVYLRQVEAKERADMFQRYVLPISASERILLRDYVFSVGAIEDARAEEGFIPVRNISLNCNWCPYVKLCQAVILGGDTDVLVRKYFTHKSNKKGGEKEDGKKDDEIEALLEEP